MRTLSTGDEENRATAMPFCVANIHKSDPSFFKRKTLPAKATIPENAVVQAHPKGGRIWSRRSTVLIPREERSLELALASVQRWNLTHSGVASANAGEMSSRPVTVNLVIIPGRTRPDYSRSTSASMSR